jgi:hypothetical protein
MDRAAERVLESLGPTAKAVLRSAVTGYRRFKNGNSNLGLLGTSRNT